MRKFFAEKNATVLAPLPQLTDPALSDFFLFLKAESIANGTCFPNVDAIKIQKCLSWKLWECFRNCFKSGSIHGKKERKTTRLKYDFFKGDDMQFFAAFQNISMVTSSVPELLTHIVVIIETRK